MAARENKAQVGKFLEGVVDTNLDLASGLNQILLVSQQSTQTVERGSELGVRGWGLGAGGRKQTFLKNT